jgi:hypothetical protein
MKAAKPLYPVTVVSDLRPRSPSTAIRSISRTAWQSCRQWLNPDAFASVVDPSTGACAGGDSPADCQFGNSGRNNVRGPRFTYSEVYVTKRVPARSTSPSASIRNSSTSSTMPTLLCPAIKRGLRESRQPRRALARSRAPFHPLPDCWASDSAAIVRRA